MIKKGGKAFCFLLMLMAAVILLPACSSSGGDEKEPVVTEVVDKLVDGLSWKDNMRQLEDSVVEKLYSFDSGAVEEVQAYISDTGATAEEVVIVKVKDKKDTGAVETQMNSRVDTLKKQFENYIPEEMVKLGNAVVTSKGKYVMLLIADEYQKGSDLFDGFFQ